MPPESHSHRAREAGEFAFSLELRRSRAAGVLAVEPVLASDLADLRAEALWKGATRRGRPELDLETGVRGPFPAPVPGEPGTSAALTFHVGDAAAASQVTFPHTCLLAVAQRAAQRLVAAGTLRAGDEFLYVLCHSARPAAPAPGAAPVRAAAGITRRRPILAARALEPLLAGARAVDAGFAQTGDHAVVIAGAALERARTIAARGLEQRPAVETGGVLLGRLASCPRSGEAFVLVEQALEATHARAEAFSLEFTGATWQRVERVLRRRQAAPGGAGELLLGQFHQHPFLPDGGLAPCADCARRAVCTRSSARLSAEDRRWCKAAFHEAPWQLSLMFGLDARGLPRVELYGQRGGALERRGYHVVERLGGSAPPGPEPRPIPSPSRRPSPCPTN